LGCCKLKNRPWETGGGFFLRSINFFNCFFLINHNNNNNEKEDINSINDNDITAMISPSFEAEEGKVISL
jgi:hypothetical protein